jgi:hypothetical protein
VRCTRLAKSYKEHVHGKGEDEHSDYPHALRVIDDVDGVVIELKGRAVNPHAMIRVHLH